MLTLQVDATYHKQLMKFLIKNSLLTAFIVCLPAFGREPLNKSERPLVYGYPQAEYHKAGSILMYTPGTELFDGVIHPDAGLYEKYFDIDKAADEHRNYISMLEKEGCSVHTVTNTLLSMSHDRSPLSCRTVSYIRCEQFGDE